MKETRNEKGFNLIELMVVIVIVAIMAAIAVPIYSRYAKSARTTEATGRLGDILTASKSYAVEFEVDGKSTTAKWPDSCKEANFIGDCTSGPKANFDYSLVGGTNDGGSLVITALGKNKMAGVNAVLTITDPTELGEIVITGF